MDDAWYNDGVSPDKEIEIVRLLLYMQDPVLRSPVPADDGSAEYLERDGLEGPAMSSTIIQGRMFLQPPIA